MIVDYLIEQGAQIDVVDVDDWTPIHYACGKGHLEIIKLMNAKDKLSFEKFFIMKTNMNATCLHLAVQSGNVQLVEYILMEFTNDRLKLFINELAEPFGTPLHIAGKESINS